MYVYESANVRAHIPVPSHLVYLPSFYLRSFLSLVSVVILW